MKTKLLIVAIVLLALSGCDKKQAPLLKEVPANFICLSRETLTELYKNGYLRGYLASIQKPMKDPETAFNADTVVINLLINTLK